MTDELAIISGESGMRIISLWVDSDGEREAPWTEINTTGRC